jgi:hypothetical protein
MITSHTSRPLLGRTFSAFALAAAAGVAATLCICAAPQAAHAQCGPQWLAPLPPVGVEGSTYAVCSWDPDGAGPLNPWLVVGGFIEAAGGMEANNVAAWDGVRWHSLNSVYGPTAPDGTKGLITALTSFDPDGDGPEVPWLIAAGGIDRTIEPTTWGFHRWMGDHWELLRSGIAPIDRGSLFQFDPDGDGPMQTQLVLVGIDKIQTFDGHSWTQIPVLDAPGLGADAIPLSVTAWDPDGSGPSPRQIVGAFYVAPYGLWPALFARWDGATWVEMSMPVPQTIFQASVYLGAWDPDGLGPQREQLYAAVDNVDQTLHRFDGAQWHEMYRDWGPTWLPVTFQPVDRDADGPLAEELLITGLLSPYFDHVAAWNGIEFVPLPNDPEAGHPIAHDICLWDQDGDHSTPPRVAAATNGLWLPGWPIVQANGVSFYDGQRWDAIGRGPSGFVRSLLRWTQDGRDVLVASGGFRTANGVPMNGVGVFDGASWKPLPTLQWPVGAIIAWDSDGNPSTLPILVATHYVDQEHMRVSALIGDQWQVLGTHMYRGKLVAAPLSSAGESLCYINEKNLDSDAVLREWNGSEWVQRGMFVGLPLGYTVDSATLWHRADGSSLLVFGGLFSGSDTVESRSAIGWDGDHFIPVGNGLRSTQFFNPIRIDAVDFDGGGPQPERLVAIGQFDRAGTSDEPFAGIAVLEGDEWRPVAVPPNWRVSSYNATQCVWDPDGPGPIMPKLRVFESLNVFAIPDVRFNVWEFDGQSLVQLSDGADGYPTSAVQWDPDGPGPIPPRIQVAGSAFSIDSPERGSVFEAFLDDATPWVATPPRDASGFDGDTITLTASIANGYAELDGGVQFQWRRDGIAIQDGPAGASTNGGVVAGASGTLHLSIPLTLTITSAATSDSGDYDLFVSNSCGTLSSAIARVQVSPFCAADIDGSGTIDATDLAAFFTAYETGATNADVDRNGGIDGADIGAFFAAYQGGC